MNQQNTILHLSDNDLFELLFIHKISSLEMKHSLYHFNRDDFIYFEDEPSEHIFLIAQGRVKIGSYKEDGKEIVKTILGYGEIFGELALTGEDRRSDYAQALDNDTTIYPLGLDGMKDLMAENKPLNLKIYKLIGQRVRKLERKIESLLFKDARTRIMEFLRDMATEKGKKVGFEVMFKNNLTHRDIASLTGTSRQTVTTILNELKDQNIINFDRRRFLIRDMDKLK
ncbi:Crp/Fnr family transcriptional regulator [Bacteroidota bacterium]